MFCSVTPKSLPSPHFINIPDHWMGMEVESMIGDTKRCVFHFQFPNKLYFPFAVLDNTPNWYSNRSCVDLSAQQCQFLNYIIARLQFVQRWQIQQKAFVQAFLRIRYHGTFEQRDCIFQLTGIQFANAHEQLKAKWLVRMVHGSAARGHIGLP